MPGAASYALSQTASYSMASPEHNQQRDTFNDRPRLPSFSNFLTATGGSDLPFDRQTTGASFVSRPATTPGDTNFPPRIEHAPLLREPFFNHTYPPPHYPTDHSHVGRLPDLGHPSTTLRQSPRGTSLTEPFSSPTSIRPPAPLRVHGHIPLQEGSRTRVVVGEEVIPGKGLCYLYDDGSSCPKIINGDIVNPDWGTTKTGKPRKRLGQACNTCREKKIKCDPSLPKCQQCQKFGRECKFAATSRSTQKHPSAQPSRESISTMVASADRSSEAQSASITSVDSSPHERSYSRSASKSSIAVDNLLSPPSTGHIHEEDETFEARRASKKLRVHIDSTDAQMQKPATLEKVDHDSMINMEAATSQTHQQFNLNVDPFEFEQDLTLYYLSKYFSHINVAIYCILPRRPFMKWVKENRKKSKWDRMLLYAILALGAVFTKDRDSKIHCEMCLTVAEEGLGQSTGIFELQIVLTRFVLSLIAYTQGQSDKGWELGGATIRAAAGMNLNVEDTEDISKNETTSSPFDFDYATLAECKRRMFWASYIMDCFNGVCSGHMLSINKSDCFLRLPCSEGLYDAGKVQEMPYFDEHYLMDPNFKGTAFIDMGMMAFLVQISTILNEVLKRINRTKLQLKERSEPSFDTFYTVIVSQIQQWEKALKLKLVLSPAENEYRGVSMPPETVSGLHILLHYSAMLLHRHVRHSHMTSTSITRNVQVAYSHARRALEILQRLGSTELRDIQPLRFVVYSPITAYVAITAIDIITAAGAVTEFLEIQNQSIELVAGGIEVLDVLAEHWETVKQLRDQVKERISTVFTACKTGSANKKKAFFIAQPLISPFGMDLDIIYGLPRLQYLQALGTGKKLNSIDDLYEAGGNSRSESSI